MARTATTQSANRPVRGRAVLAGAALVALTAVAYVPAYRAGFVWDDDMYVIDNQTLRDWSGLVRIWTDLSPEIHYYPLTFTVFWVEHQLWGLHPAGYHVVNVLLHALNAVLVWRVLRRLEVPAAWVVGAVFALHPVHVESVAWVTEHKNTISGVFYLLAALAYLRFRPLTREGEVAHGPWRLYVLGLLAFVAAMLAKTAICTFPAALLLVTWWKTGRIRLRDVGLAAPFFLIAIGLSALTYAQEVHKFDLRGPDWDYTLAQRIIIVGRVAWFYVATLAWPVEPCFVHPRWEIDAGQWWQWLYPLGMVATLVVLWLLRRRIGRGPLTALLFFGGTLLPVIGLFRFYFQRYSLVGDHFVYIPSLGVLALLVATAAAALRSLRLTGLRSAPAAAVALLLLAAGAWRHAQAFHNIETLWRGTLAKNPDAYLALNNLGNHLLKDGRTAEAIALLERAVQVRPHDTKYRLNLANAYTLAKRYPEALADYKFVLAREPRNAEALNQLGGVYLETGRGTEALETWVTAVEIDPTLQTARKNVASVLLYQLNVLIQTADRAAVLDFASRAVALAQRLQMPELATQIRREAQTFADEP